MYSCEPLQTGDTCSFSSLFFGGFVLSVFGSATSRPTAHSLLSSSSNGRFKPGMNLRMRLRKLFCLGFLCSELTPPCLSPEVDEDEGPLMWLRVLALRVNCVLAVLKSSLAGRRRCCFFCGCCCSFFLSVPSESTPPSSRYGQVW